MGDSIVVFDDFVLSYIKQPGQKLYYISRNEDLKLFCTSNIHSAHKFLNRNIALDEIRNIKDLFGFDFSLERL